MQFGLYRRKTHNYREKKLKSRSERARISIRESELSLVIAESVKNKKISKQMTRIFPENTLKNHLKFAKVLKTMQVVTIST